MHSKALLLVFLIGFPILASAQSYKKSIREFQEDLNKSFTDPEKSPLSKEKMEEFKGLPFFPIDEKYSVTAKLEWLPPSNPLRMRTSDDRLRAYDRFAKATFTLDGKEYTLILYSDRSSRQKEESKNRLFLPFTDQSNGTGTYGGGRYIDLEIPEGDTIVIDFNKAYNP
ncbi:hypothetical protein C943_04310 [Mariniradius saccharolyticus AK6]|uniref:DUF1684 domain-containing protein n=1 Tax=Mariniradius saccharolyticus AK6 TaxID=1239962 RepID=M7XY78_9BACT|nr:hypothetical protein C943_04310 [Mariniradius saccharolyticus AK6]